MIILRLLFLLSALGIVLSGGMYIFTRNNYYLRLAWQIVRFIGFMALVFGALFLLERYVLVGWGILL